MRGPKLICMNYLVCPAPVDCIGPLASEKVHAGNAPMYSQPSVHDLLQRPAAAAPTAMAGHGPASEHDDGSQLSMEGHLEQPGAANFPSLPQCLPIQQPWGQLMSPLQAHLHLWSHLCMQQHICSRAQGQHPPLPMFPAQVRRAIGAFSDPPTRWKWLPPKAILGPACSTHQPYFCCQCCPPAAWSSWCIPIWSSCSSSSKGATSGGCACTHTSCQLQQRWAPAAKPDFSTATGPGCSPRSTSVAAGGHTWTPTSCHP